MNRNRVGNGLADRAKVSKIFWHKSQSKTGLGQKNLVFLLDFAKFSKSINGGKEKLTRN